MRMDAIEPMEAHSADDIPVGPGWQYEQKFDGFRCIASRDGDQVAMQSKSGQPLARYFPDLVADLLRVAAEKFVLDGEIVIPMGDDVLSFEELQMRLHPAASRVAKLAAAHPARLVLFDMLVAPDGRALVDAPLRARRAALEAAMASLDDPALALSPVSDDPAQARAWLLAAGTGRDGVVAKRLDAPYRAGRRDAMTKVKRVRTADCVVGGFRHLAKQRQVGSMLLGLYDDAGLLDHVGFCSTIAHDARAALTTRLEALIGPPGFSGKAPGGPSRWSKGEAEWFPLRPELVVEVRFDHVSGGRFRHGTTMVRFRPDKAASQCRMEQISVG